MSENAMKCIMPEQFKDIDAQLRYLENVDEKLRRDHNVKGDAFRAGKLSAAEWEAYKTGRFNPKSEATRLAIGSLAQQRAAEIMGQSGADLAYVDIDAAFE